MTIPVTNPHIDGTGPYSITCTACDPYVAIWGDTKAQVKQNYADHCAELHPA